MLDFLELEETVGRAWHRLVGATASYPVHPRARGRRLRRCRARSRSCSARLAGRRACRSRAPRRASPGIGSAGGSASGLATSGSTIPGATAPPCSCRTASRCSPTASSTPRSIAGWPPGSPSRRSPRSADADPLRRDLLTLRRARETVGVVLTRFPGLAEPYARLAAAMAHGAAAPAAAAHRAGGGAHRAGAARRRCAAGRQALAGRDRCRRTAGEGAARLPADAALSAVGRLLDPRGRYAGAGDDDDAGAGRGGSRARTRASASPSASARTAPSADPFILNRFEKILAMAEMVNVDRPSDDSEDEDARKAADDLDELAISRRKRQARDQAEIRSRSAAAKPSMPRAWMADRLYPEWDYRSRAYLQDHCRVLTRTRPPRPARPGRPDETMRRHDPPGAAAFEALRPRHD